MLIPRRALVASSSFGTGLPAAAVAEAIGRGLRTGGMPAPDLCPVVPRRAWTGEVRELLDALDFDVRMRSARAVVVAAARLQERTLADSVTFEIATRARQAGVPAYAVAGENRLNGFDARILDLQLIVEADSARSLAAAGRQLARLL